MKEKIVKITCDKCNTKHEFPEGDKYPYDQGWQYIHKFNGQFVRKNTHKLQEKTVERLNIEDLHFCSMKCVVSYLENILHALYKSKDEVLKKVEELDPFAEGDFE